MAGKPGTREEHAQTQRWAQTSVRSSTSVLIKRLKAYLPEEDSINEGSEM